MEHQEMPEWAHQKLERRASKAILFLQQLTSTPQFGEGPKSPVMPKSAVVTAEGIAIMSKNKYGAMVTYLSERGFLIRKIPGPQVRWSAPVFVTGSCMGAGFSGGFTKARTCLAFANGQAVDSFLKGKSEFGPAVHFLLDMNGSRIKRASFDSSEHQDMTKVERDKFGGVTARYFQVEAAMIDISIQGGSTAVDTAFNAAVYGRDVGVEQILSGSVPPPSEFELLYTMLQQFVEETPGASGRREVAHQPTRKMRNVRSIAVGSTSPDDETTLNRDSKAKKRLSDLQWGDSTTPATAPS